MQQENSNVHLCNFGLNNETIFGCKVSCDIDCTNIVFIIKPFIIKPIDYSVQDLTTGSGENAQYNTIKSHSMDYIIGDAIN